LLRFLDGELNADDDARIVAHVENCATCQERLERLTEDHSTPEVQRLIETVRADAQATVDQARTEDVILESGEQSHLGDPDQSPSTGPDELVPDRRRHRESSADFRLAPPPNTGGSTEEPDDGEASAMDEPDDSATAPASGPESNRVTRRLPRGGWPAVTGYDVIQRLGEGGMGVVYKARHLGLNRLVALKMIRGASHARADHLARFRIEAEAVARLRHVNILQIYDIGEASGLPFVALELLDGGSLDDRLAGTPQPGKLAAELVASLARAVHVAHNAGIVHRDLKPSNVLYTSDGVPKITDFGLAKRIDSDAGQTESGQIMGSPSYMAPEQARGQSRQVGPAADVYSLGAILYEALCGRPPFKGETPMETIRQVVDDDPVAPSRLVPRVARDLETICLKCLHKDAARRYESAAALADDLTRFLRGEPIQARRTAAWERAGKWAKRRPLVAASWIVGIVAALGAVAWGFAWEHASRLAVEAHGRTIAAAQTQGNDLLHEADTSSTRVGMENARVHLSEFLSRTENLKNAPEIQSLLAILAQRRDALGRQLEMLNTREVQSHRIQKFRDLRNEATLHAARLMVLDPAEHQKALRAATLAALTVYAKEPEAPASNWSPVDPLPEALEPAEKAEVNGGCYDLLLLLSEAEEPADGLKVLDCALRLHPEPGAAYHLRRAASQARAGNDAERLREEELARLIKPASALDHFLIGREQLARGQTDEAVSSLGAAIKLDPDQLGAQLLLARAAYGAERLGSAKEHLDACLRKAPKLVGLYLFRALVSGEAANRALSAAGQVPPLQATRLRNEAKDAFSAAEADYRRALGLNPSAEFRYVLLVNRSGMYLQAGGVDLAAADLDAAIALDPGPYQAHAQQFQVLERLGRLDQAGAALDRAIGRQAGKAELFRRRAALAAPPVQYGYDGARSVTPVRRAAAIADLERALALETDTAQKADEYAELGRLRFVSGQTALALEAYDAALLCVPSDPKALRLRTFALLELKRYDEVLEACDKSLAKGQPSADILEARGLARLERKDFRGAIGDYTVALSLAPGSAALANHRAWAYLFSDAFKLALADFDAALRMDPDLADAYSGRALARVGLGSWREALADADRAISLVSAPGKHRAYFNAARVHAHALRHADLGRGHQGDAGPAQYRRIRTRVTALLHESASELPPTDRAVFWRDVVASDPILRPFVPGAG
jgi:serine/threonine protein kinase/tetratricopeptide (TPR) repeat protein